MFKVLFHPVAVEDLYNGYWWYDEKEPGLGNVLRPRCWLHLRKYVPARSTILILKKATEEYSYPIFRTLSLLK